jgi:ectoine hydroxylase-related dioxygenase (phytanoyl-CoA dioxygenase family)
VRIWGQRRIPSPEQITDYRERGFIHLSGVIDAARLNALVGELEKVLAEHDGGTDSAWRGSWRDQFEGGDKFTLRTIDKLGKRNEFWRNWLSSREILGPIEALSGKPMAHTDAMLIVKPPETGQAFPPHQDAAYYAGDEPDYIIATLHLNATTTENGAVRYLPGSHKHGLLEHVRKGKAFLPSISLDDLVEVRAQPGDLVCSSIYTVHGSLPNRSNGARALVRIGYRPC